MEPPARVLLAWIILNGIFSTSGLADLSTSTSSTAESTGLEGAVSSPAVKVDRGEEGRSEAVPMTEQVMDPDIKISQLPGDDDDDDRDVATTDPLDSSQGNKVVRDVAYYLRGHKFQEYDRRYYKIAREAPSQLYEDFPRPPLRSLHWEVRKYCEPGFQECLRYLERIIKVTALRRQDDTVTVMKEQNWSLANNSRQILAVQRDCLVAQRRDNLTMPPFQGPIERFQWRTSASYYMCWYTMVGHPELEYFGEPCDNHANCLLEYGPRNGDPRADDTKSYSCALYSFCPDHCCPMKHIWYMKDCFQSPVNPCYDGNPPAHRKCALKREENRDFLSLQANRINISCECQEVGYEWSSRFGLCVDINECTRGLDNCSTDSGESCMNLPGRFECVCVLGHVYDPGEGHCVPDRLIEEALAWQEEEKNFTDTRSVLLKILEAIASSAHCPSKCTRMYTVLISVAAILVAYGSSQICPLGFDC